MKLFKSFNTFKHFKTLEKGGAMAIMCLRPNTPQSSCCPGLLV
jgi:hypothetical protein